MKKEIWASDFSLCASLISACCANYFLQTDHVGQEKWPPSTPFPLSLPKLLCKRTAIPGKILIGSAWVRCSHRSTAVSREQGKVGFPGGSDDKASVCNARDPGLIPGLGRSPGKGNGNPPQYSCPENPMDRGAWQATVLGVTKSRTRLSYYHTQGKVIS